MLWNDLRYACRLLGRSPGFAVAAILSLALGIGANTAIFSLFHTIVLRTMPVAHPEELVEFLQWFPGESGARSGGYWDWNSYQHFRENSQAFSAMTGMSFDNLATVRTEGAEPERVILENTQGNYFRVLGLTPSIGRLIGPDDAPLRGDGDVVVLSWSFWSRRFKQDPGIIGKRILVGDAPKTVIGVAPRAYTGPRVGARTDLWIPRERDDLTMLARLKPGVTIQQAQAEMARLYRFTLEQRALHDKNPRVWQARIELEPAGAGLTRVRDQYAKPLALLMAVVGLLLLLGCFNVASLLLARSIARQPEMAVRVGIGASQGRLVRQLLTESMLLSCAGALAGVAVAYVGTGLLVRILSSGRAHEHIEIQVDPDLTILLFTATTAVVAGLLLGLAPAWHAFHSAPALALRQSGSGAVARPWRLLGKGLVAAQVAVSVVLVSGAALFLDHLTRLRNLDLGFRSDGVLLFDVDPSRSGYPRAQLTGMYRELLGRLESIPGVTSASISCCTPLQGCGCGGRFVTVEGKEEEPGNLRRTPVTWIAPKYFATMGVPLVGGRDFTFQDSGAPRAAIVSQAMAQHYFPNGDAIGKRLSISPYDQPGQNQQVEIVGIAGDAKFTELRDAPARTVYLNMFQDGRVMNQFSVRTSVNPASLSGAVRRVVREALRTVPVTRVTTLSEQVDATIVPERLVATLSQLFGAMGAILAGIGLYALLAQAVARRTSEIGIRMALGATAGDVTRLVLREVSGIVGVGLLAGALMVQWGIPFAAALVQDLKPEVRTALILGSGAMSALALLAAWVPLRRAARVEPVIALRHH